IEEAKAIAEKHRRHGRHPIKPRAAASETPVGPRKNLGPRPPVGPHGSETPVGPRKPQFRGHTVTPRKPKFSRPPVGPHSRDTSIAGTSVPYPPSLPSLLAAVTPKVSGAPPSANSKLPWSTPTLVEVLDKEEARRIRKMCGPDPAARPTDRIE